MLGAALAFGGDYLPHEKGGDWVQYVGVAGIVAGIAYLIQGSNTASDGGD